MATACLAFASFGCGGATSSSPDLDETSSLDPVANIIMSDAYAGYLVMHLDESMGAQLDESKQLYSTKAQSDALSSLQSAIDSFSGVELKRSVDIDPERLNALRARLERKSGKTLADFNSIYKIEAPDPNEALSLFNVLKSQAGVSNIYPGQKLALMSIASVPDLTGHQGYLYPESTHGGLNAQAAWNEGVLGANVRVIDFEMAWNHEHEDLSVPANTYQCSIPSTDPACQKKIAHGTSVAGIIGSLHNGHGTDGFAPEAALELEDIHIGTIEGSIVDLLENGLAPGSVIFIEVAAGGLNANDPNCITDTYGCIPTSMFPYNFNGIEYAIAAGVTVIEGAGNGYVDLGDPSHYGSSYVNISTNDSGSIMVGASFGANKQIRADSNYGTRVNVFAWGDRVVTTGYPYSGSPYIWDGSLTPAPANNETNTYYTNMFGGTSAATAMIAGAAALVQSYAKQELGQPTTRYITPQKMRDMLVMSGVSQVGGGGNIGKQPRIDIAMNLVDALVNNAYSQFPALESGEELTENELAALQNMGIGLICAEADPETHALVGANDPSCPDAVLWPEGNYISKPYDFDGDGRADLVKFNKTWWYVDLSSKGTAADGFGAWDIAVQFTPLPGETVWPYVADMNSDGRCDFVAYDKLNGTFYVHLTDSALIEHNEWHGWDWEIDYSSEWHDEYTADPDDANYSRPVLGNFNMTGSANSIDGFTDIALICSDGFVRIDYGDATENSLGTFDRTAQLLTDDMLAQAPGWAYTFVAGNFGGYGATYIALKVPDGLPDEGKMYLPLFWGYEFNYNYDWIEQSGAGPIFGGNDVVQQVGQFTISSYPVFGLKDGNGQWKVTSSDYSNLVDLSPVDIYGGPECHPALGDYDGDDVDDRAVMCPDEWRIAYSSAKYDALRSADYARHVPLTYDPAKFELPGRSYNGGISYSYAQQLMEEYQAQHPGQPVPIMVDMITMSSGN